MRLTLSLLLGALAVHLVHAAALAPQLDAVDQHVQYARGRNQQSPASKRPKKNHRRPEHKKQHSTSSMEATAPTAKATILPSPTSFALPSKNACAAELKATPSKRSPLPAGYRKGDRVPGSVKMQSPSPFSQSQHYSLGNAVTLSWIYKNPTISPTVVNVEQYGDDCTPLAEPTQRPV